MYEHLRGYDSIDQLVAERRDDLISGLNELPVYLDIVNALKGDRHHYKIGIFAWREESGTKVWSRYMSINDNEGKVQEIVKCSNIKEPDIAISVEERGLLDIINDADNIGTAVESGEFTIREVGHYRKSTHLQPARPKDYLKVGEFFRVLGYALKQYQRRLAR